MENISFGKIINLIKQNSKIIFLFAVVGFITGLLYVTFIFKPIYKSTAKMLIKNNEPQTFITELGTSNPITPLTRDGNPTLTQIQILESRGIAEQVWNEISSKYGFKDDTKIGIELMKSSISVQNLVGTDIMELTASWTDPNTAKDIANSFVSAYINSNIEISKKGILQSRASIDKELKHAQDKLFQTREKIKAFRQVFSTVDIATESANIVTQTADLENRYQDILSTSSLERNRVKSIAEKLGVDWHNAINSIALGYNTNISALQARLGTTQEELAGISTKYAKTHPAMMALESRIDQIKSDLSNQIKQTVGNKVDSEGMIISDPVRTSMMEELVRSEALYRGLLAQSNILLSALKGLKSKASTIPQKQHILSNLLQEEMNWTEIVNALKTKQIESKIKESEVVSNIDLIDSPIIPLISAFPGRTVVMGFFTLIGLLFGVAGVLMNWILKDTCDDIEEIEEELKAPILGVIPWLDNQTYNQPESLSADGTASYYALAYQKLISCLRIKSINSRTKSLVFSSSEYSKERSTVLMNIAYGLNRAGQSVIVIDADFRTPSIHKELGINVNDKFNLAELITTYSKEVLENGEFNWKYLSYFLQEIPECHSLHILPNKGNVNDPYEYINSPSFNIIIKNLKDRYDWVLIDAPPALAVPDAVNIASYTDGAVIITGLEANKADLRKIYKHFKNNLVGVFGVIARETHTNEAISSNEYLKQIISEMMPSEDAVIRK